MCFNPGPERRVPSPNRYIADTKFCFCKNNKRIIIILDGRAGLTPDSCPEREVIVTCTPLPLLLWFFLPWTCMSSFALTRETPDGGPVGVRVGR